MKSAMDERYAKLYEDLFKDGLAYAEKAFSERGLPMTDVEDVAAESALKVIAANRRGAFKSAQTDKNREEMQHNRLKCLILDAARRLGYQARQVSLSVLDEKPEDDVARAQVAEIVAATSDRGKCAEELAHDDNWLSMFKSAESALLHDDNRKRKKNLSPKEREAETQARQDKQDERNEYRRIKRSIQIPAARPKDIPHVRRVKARQGLRNRFKPSHEAYRRELEAAQRKVHK